MVGLRESFCNTDLDQFPRCALLGWNLENGTGHVSQSGPPVGGTLPSVRSISGHTALPQFWDGPTLSGRSLESDHLRWNFGAGFWTVPSSRSRTFTTGQVFMHPLSDILARRWAAHGSPSPTAAPVKWNTLPHVPDPPPSLKMLQRVLLAPLLLALAHARAAQEQSPTSSALDRVTIDVAGDGKQPMVVEVVAELPPPLQLHYNVTTGGHGHGPVVIDLTEETRSPRQDSVREAGQVCPGQMTWGRKRVRMFCGSRWPLCFWGPISPPARFLTQHRHCIVLNRTQQIKHHLQFVFAVYTVLCTM